MVGTAMRTTSQPLFGPCVPLSVTGPSVNQVEKTPTTMPAIAVHVTGSSDESPPRRVASAGNERRHWHGTLAEARSLALAVAALVAAALFVLLYREVLGIAQLDVAPAAGGGDVCGCPGGDRGVRGARRCGSHDAAPDFAWSTAATIEPFVEGANFFPRILADVDVARSSVHILMFGWREGQIGTEMAALLERKLQEGVEVQVIVDRFGSRPYDEARRCSLASPPPGADRRQRRAIDRDGLYPDDQHLDWRQDEVGRADHRRSSTSSMAAWRGRVGRASRITSRTAAST